MLDVLLLLSVAGGFLQGLDDERRGRETKQRQIVKVINFNQSFQWEKFFLSES